MIEESPIFVKTYDFTKWLLEHTIKFPKSQRFFMAKRVEEATLTFYDFNIRHGGPLFIEGSQNSPSFFYGGGNQGAFPNPGGSSSHRWKHRQYPFA